MTQTAMENALGVIADIEGCALTEDDRLFLSQPEVSGIILFGRNYQSPQQLRQLTTSLKQLRSDLLISVDQEGGRVQRFREGFSRIPAMLSFEKIWQKSPDECLLLVNQMAELLALECRLAGIDLTYAPVLDIEQGCSKVIGDRAFGHSATAVVALATAWCDGLAKVGFKAVGKHFPGHGGVVADSHFELPTDERNANELAQDIEPFKQLIATGHLAGIMPAHVVYPSIDVEHTAGFSAVWLQQYLRQSLGFGGVIFSDDLSMAGAAAAGNFADRATAAIKAGANALLACNNREAAQIIIETVRKQRQPYLDLSSWCQPELSLVIEDQYQARVKQLRIELNEQGWLTDKQ